MAQYDADEVFTAAQLLEDGSGYHLHVNDRILGNDAPGAVTHKILDTYWDFHKRPDLNTDIIYK